MSKAKVYASIFFNGENFVFEGIFAAHIGQQSDIRKTFSTLPFSDGLRSNPEMGCG